jgi:hypothetical protein
VDIDEFVDVIDEVDGCLAEEDGKRERASPIYGKGWVGRLLDVEGTKSW